MRILLTTHQFFPKHYAGTEVAARDAALELLARGHDVHVLTVDPTVTARGAEPEAEEYEYRGLKVHAVALPQKPRGASRLRAEFRNEPAAAHVRDYVAALRPDVVHMYHIGRLSGLTIDVLHEFNVPLVFTSTDFWSFCVRGILMKPSGELCAGPDDISSNCLECRRAERWFDDPWSAKHSRRKAYYRRLAESRLAGYREEEERSKMVRTALSRTAFLRERFNSLDAICAPTELMRDMLVANGIRPDLVRVSPYSIDLSQFEAVRSQHRAPTNGLRFGYVGTINPPKGVHVMLEAFRRLGPETAATLEVVGDARKDRDYFADLYELAAGDPRIRFAGAIPNEQVPDRLKRIDVQIVPSTWYENAPLTIYSAQAAGVPVVASNLGGMAEVVGDQENGLLFEPGDVDGLSQRLRELVEQPQLVERLRSQARRPRSVVEGVDDLLSLYEEIRQRRSSPVTVVPGGAAVDPENEAGRAEEVAEMADEGVGRRRAGVAPSTSLGTAARRLADRGTRRAQAGAGVGGADRVAPAANVFFIVGRAKSGTTWVTRTLNAHPEILARGEGRFFGREYVLESPETPTIPARPLAGALDSNAALRSWLERSVWARDGDTDRQMAEITRLLTDHFLTAAVAGTGKRIVGDKTPFLRAGIVAEIASVHPSAKVIHIIRDGRDIAISAKHHIWNRSTDEGGIHDLEPEERAARDAYRADPEAFASSGRSLFNPDWLAGTAEEWAEMTRTARADGRKLLGDRYLELRYEDMQEDAEREVRAILEFLGADASPARAASCVEHASFERATKGRKPGDERPTQFLRMGIAGEWRKVFTERDREAFKAAAGDFLIELGYERDKAW